MIDPKLLRADIDTTAQQLKIKNYDLDIKAFLALEAQRKSLQSDAERLQQERNAYAKSMGQLIGQAKKNGEDIAPLKNKGEELKKDSIAADLALLDVQDQLEQILHSIPNIPHNSVPAGIDESDNIEVRRWGTPKEFTFTVKDHVDLGAGIGQLDFNRASKITGSRFSLMRGPLAGLHRALTQFMIGTHINDHGYEEVYVPYAVNKESLFGTGQLPKFEEDLFKLEDNREFYLIPTAEVPVTNIYREEIIDDLPIKLVAHTPCFRSEAGSYGKDTRGMIRQHQFEKVEMVSVTHPDASDGEQKRMLRCAEDLLEQLDVPYRTVLLCTGDMGFGARRTYDIEAWLPGQNAYREISSVSTTGDFQARRMNARFKPADGGKPEYVHTLNGSGLAVGRCLIAVLENGQQADGSVQLPAVLHTYLGGKSQITTAGVLA